MRRYLVLLCVFATASIPIARAEKQAPEKADRGIRALMVQDETGYANWRLRPLPRLGIACHSDKSFRT